MRKIIKESKSKKEYVNSSRMDIIGQNGNDGLHYAEIGTDDAISYIEKNYPETAKEFQRLQFEQWQLFCQKQMDYGPSNIAMGTDLTTSDQKRLSKIGLIVRINDKVQRLINLVIKNNREAQNEPTIDAFKDLACYGIIAQIVDNGKWGK
tara:strand:+ start:1751 stop:2200 length:450 start_codon:yes stop_codon:yes gene_type:complete